MTGSLHPTTTGDQTTAPLRCAACGQPIGDAPIDKCPLCGSVIGDRRTTGTDVTPYALSFENDQPRLFRMCKWIWTAGPERLKHLAMMRASSASRRFATIHVVFLALALGALRTTLLGWRVVSRAQASTGSVTGPTGKGWFRIVSLSPLPGDESASAIAGTWWNPAQALLGGAIALVAAFVLIAIVRGLIRVGVETAHAKVYRGEQRMAAAQCYATAWLIPIILATAILWILPVTITGTSLSGMLLLIPAGIIAGIGVIFGWFWSLRLAATAPVDTRGRVTIMLALGAPAITLAGAATWWLGLDKLYNPLFDALQMSF